MRYLMLLALTGCSLVSNDIGCDLRTEEASNGYEDRCQERTGLQGNTLFGGFCDLLGGIDLDGGCPDEGKVAGCDITAGFDGTGTVVDWYYAPVTEEEVASICEDDGGDVVLP
jgi:hypothetical protein